MRVSCDSSKVSRFREYGGQLGNNWLVNIVSAEAIVSVICY